MRIFCESDPSQPKLRSKRWIKLLTKLEFDLLAVFMKHPNLVQTRDMLLDLVCGYDSLLERSVADVYIRYLRNKLDVPGKNISCQQN
jgi:DNA-binding response OmpR family regulator